ILGILGFGTTICFMFHTIRRVVLVNRFYKMVNSVNIFNQVPLYSLSGLTARSAAGFVLLANIDVITNVLTLQSSQNLGLALANTAS
ncbi:MAG: hypothetical protein N2D54_05370, partial [Chloroflexota bacterium]